MQLRWIASFSASCLHATTAMIRGNQLTDSRLAAVLAEPSAAMSATLTDSIATDVALRDTLLEHLTAQAAGIENNRQLAEVALTKTLGKGRFAETAQRRLTGAIADCEAAFARAIPAVADELVTRGEPLKLQWEARGPGLLASIGRKTEAGLLAERADAVLVYPALGGGGAAHLAYNSVRIEAVLANPAPTLPEVVRLGWLLAQLNLDLPIYSDHMNRRNLPRVARLAMIPPALVAAENVELARFDTESLRLAIATWCPAEDAAAVAGALVDWYRAYENRRPPIPVALGALDKMLAELS